MIKIVQVLKEEWQQFSENAHLIVFAEKKPSSVDRIDFALVAEGRDSRLLGYITCKEFDSESLYWQFGGAFPGTKKTSVSFQMYLKALSWCESRYQRVMTLVENKNLTMLKMHLASGFIIVGFRSYNGQGLVELTKEFSREVGA